MSSADSCVRAKWEKRLQRSVFVEGKYAVVENCWILQARGLKPKLAWSLCRHRHFNKHKKEMYFQ